MLTRARHAFWPFLALLAAAELASCHPAPSHASTKTDAGGSDPARPRREAPNLPLVSDAVSESERPLKVPSGEPPRVTCAQARVIVDEVRHRLPAEPTPISAPDFAELWADWFDPHGLWSAAPDAPLADAARVSARALITEIESADATRPCSAALALGALAKRWVDGLRAVFEQARIDAPPVHFSRALAGVLAPAFEEEVVSRPARLLAADLGRRTGQFLKLVPELADAPASTALSRFFPELSAEQWSEIVLAAAVRAYVPAIDPHGEWAPLDEEWALFAGDPLDEPDPSLWSSAVRTPLGVRIVSGPYAPLELDDLVLSVDGTETAGLSMEQAEQLARADAPKSKHVHSLRVLRGDVAAAVDLSVVYPDDSEGPAEPLPGDGVRYGEGWVHVITVKEVGDRLGEQIADLLALAHQDDEPKALGILLDLRGNGGGSTDGAAAAIGTFLPGVPSFPLIHRGVVSEIMRATVPEEESIWRGPVAVLVDGYTASAAEMIAGALDRYGRGPLLGAHTFGKGCVQEYFDDRSGQGVLRLTTLLVALPDGSPLQQVGLEPEISLGLPAADEHEADLVGSPKGVAGPDIRNAAAMGAVPWPSAHGRVGPCVDAVICSALQRLGSGQPVRRGRAGNPAALHTRRPPRPRPVLGDAEHSAHGFTQSREGRGTSPR